MKNKKYRLHKKGHGALDNIGHIILIFIGISLVIKALSGDGLSAGMTALLGLFLVFSQFFGFFMWEWY